MLSPWGGSDGSGRALRTLERLVSSLETCRGVRLSPQLAPKTSEGVVRFGAARHIQFHKVGVARFPNVAYLQCCARNYEQPAAGAQQMRCFAKGCTLTACPARQIGAAGCDRAVPRAERRLGFKYRDEGFSAILHATALSFDGARWNFAADMVPPRLDIRLPAGLGVELARGEEDRPASRDDSFLFTCKTCESANFVDAVSYNVTACLFTEYVYDVPAMETARKGHNCRYFDPAPLAAVCQALGHSSTGELRRDYGWFCGDVLPLLAREMDGK